MSALVVALSAIAIGCVGLVLVGLSLLMEARRSRVVLEHMLDGFHAAYETGFETLSIDMNRLNDRVSELERRE